MRGVISAGPGHAWLPAVTWSGTFIKESGGHCRLVISCRRRQAGFFSGLGGEGAIGLQSLSEVPRWGLCTPLLAAWEALQGSQGVGLCPPRVEEREVAQEDTPKVCEGLPTCSGGKCPGTGLSPPTDLEEQERPSSSSSKSKERPRQTCEVQAGQ